MRHSIRGRFLLVFIGLVVIPLLVMGSIVAWQSYTLLQQQTLAMQEEKAARVAVQVTAYFQGLENELRYTIKTRGLDDPDIDPSRALSDLLAYEPAFQELQLLNDKGGERISVYRTEPPSNRTVNRPEADEFLIPLNTKEAYYGPVQIDPSTHEPLMILSVPVVYEGTGAVDGVLVSVIRIQPVWDILAGIPLGKGQSAYIVDGQGKVVAHRDPTVALQGASFPVPQQDGIQPGLNGGSVALAFSTITLGQQQLNVIAEQTLSEAMAPAVHIVILILLLTVAVAAIAIVFGLWNMRRMIGPIQDLTEAVDAIGAGDLTSRPLVISDDEIGILAGTFNNMARQLRDRIGSLEHRVEDCTRALATFSNVTRLSVLLDEKQLAAEVAERVRNAFHAYSALIYFYDKAGDNLILTGGSGDAGKAMLAEGYKIPKGTGPAGRVAESNAPVRINDTSQEPGWQPNPLLPKTKSETAVPISAGDQVLGVLDVQHNIADGMTEADVDLLQSIANQVAVAVRNTRSYTPDRRQAEREALIASINRKILETTTVEDALRMAVSELGRALGLRETRVVLSDSPQAGRAEAESKPGDGN